MKLDRVENLLRRLDNNKPRVCDRDARYRGVQKLKFTNDEIQGDLKYFGVNVCRLAVNAVAERMRVQAVEATVGGQDVTADVMRLWKVNNLDQRLQAVLCDALSLGAAYWVVWVDEYGHATISPESARHMVVERHPVTREVTGAVKRWFVKDHNGVLVDEHVVAYDAHEIVHYTRGGNNTLDVIDTITNPLGVVPVVAMVNYDRLDDEVGYSVIDDLADLVDALSKILADVLTASESVARPRRWATGVDLEDREDEFTADGGVVDVSPLDGQAMSPFGEDSTFMAVENEAAKFGQLPGADLKGYETAVNILVQQIQATSGLPPHMLGITTANPSSADAIRAAEASLTARAESRIRVLGLALEQAMRLLVAIDRGVDVANVEVELRWASPATSSKAQEVDAITKLVALNILTVDEAREQMGITQ